MLARYSLTDLASFLGMCVGFAFAAYVVRTIGSFSVVGPELLGLFLEANLISGAIIIVPWVIFWMGALAIGVNAVSLLWIILEDRLRTAGIIDDIFTILALEHVH